MAGFRNVVVHEYLTVDPDRVYYTLQVGLADLEQFIEHILEFLRREGYLDADSGAS